LLGLPRLAFMTEIKEDFDQQCKEQASVALRRLQDALVKHVEDINIGLQAGLAVRETPTAIEVHEIEKPDALLRFTLTRENNINYTQLIKRNYERQSGVIYVRTSQDGCPVILFSDFPHPNERVSCSREKKRETKQRVKKARPIRSVVSQWLDADYHKFTEAVVRVLMADQRETA
jgi:hypothetical protein